MNPTQERWLPVPGYEGYYEVSDHGNVRSVDRWVPRVDGKRNHYTGKALTLLVDPEGYRVVRLSRDGQTRSKFAHRLVVEAFNGPVPDGLVCCHNDNDPSNNRLDNIRVDTQAGNIADKRRFGTDANASKTHCIHGHPFDAENTQIVRGKHRQCKTCSRERLRRWRARNTAA